MTGSIFGLHVFMDFLDKDCVIFSSNVNFLILDKSIM